ncbi:MAG TPA: GvpL/GvpF family gas vesicle protein [Pyrinomonadaceae bacterium]
MTPSLYVYCLGEELGGAAFEGLAGVGGARVRLLALGGLAAAVSEAGAEGAPVNEENLLAHNRVNAAALAVSTPLPCRFGTRAAPERLAEYVSANGAALAAALARVRGCVEMSVKLMSKPGVGGQEPGGEIEAGAADFGAGGAGTAFLLKKRREILGEEGARRRAEGAAAWLAGGLNGLARETAERLSPPEAIFVRAAHLVERGRVAEYRARLRALAAGRRDLRLLASGPWPPYSFSDVKGTTNHER